MARKKHNYVDNKKFLEAMIEYRDEVIETKKHNVQRPIVPDYIGECIMKIATHLSHKPNFINYTFREDMISDGIENCLQYIDNFNPEKSKNPFAYFTQIIFFAFLRRIQKEKKVLATKIKYTNHINIFDETTHKQEHDTKIYPDEIKHSEWSQEYMSTFVENFEKHKRRKIRKRVTRLDKIFEEGT